ncbi:hypothetical protein BCR33DRAFT_434631 [Rhizoclosmatium globosum]|uniref:Receptor ligand binding region domain-containing protein n=1 Tax=Rhizoclosmatium globosum TaxID=329046 RepID=A0A1Y2BVT9_9FUNG|nr:hypothetical protein BCR33DRAFT_434631 [Rhizoclosmatium globosum]|eukprot:ORY38215.1 hypothetical protein BCR33DRAFT_434631 [Rhizoclosmatium globosum]
MGMITPTHVWFATQPPYPPDYSGAGVDSRLDIIVGMIYPAPYAEPQSDPNLISLNAQWKALYTQDPMKYQVDHFTWTNAGSYDCVGTLLSGFDQLLRKNPGFSVGMLAARRLQDRLSFETFRNTGFNGTLLNPVVLDDHGDIAANTMFTSLNETFWINGGSQPSFAEINKQTAP